MRKRFKNFIEANNLIEPNGKTLLAVSGGIDSMVMLKLFFVCGYDFAVAHCNFDLRGHESDVDEELVRNACEVLGKELHIKKFSTSSYAKENNLSIQVAARNLRYQWFKDLCDEFGYNAVAVAHNKNDIAETILINLCRGTGLKGLTGIKPLTNGIIRPLLFAFRKEIEDYATKNGIAYRTDSSNKSLKYARNRVRHNIIPELEHINKGVVDNLVSTSKFLGQTWQAIESMNSEFIKNVRKEQDGEIIYSIKELLNYPFRQVFLLEELTKWGFPAAMVLDIEESLTTQSGKIFYSDKLQLIRDREYLIISPHELKILNNINIDTETSSISEPVSLKFEVVKVGERFVIPKFKNIGVFDYNKLSFPLTLRPWRNGDWFIPFGMKGRKKISNLLIDQKVPLHQKNQVLVLESNGDIIWVVGFRIDNRYKVLADTQKVLRVELLKK